MKRIALSAGAFLACALGAAVAQEERGDLLGEAFAGVAFGDTVEQVTRKLDGECDELVRVEVAEPYLPLAKESQVHLIARVAYAAGVEEVAFTFGDDALVQVEARGGAIEGLWAVLDEDPLAFEGYQAKLSARVVALPEEDTVWLLSPDGLHPHLYLWANPDLPAVAPPREPYARAAARPAILEFGARLEQLMPRFERACPRLQREEIGQPWLATEPEVQTQINLFGVVYAGFPRKIEAVFGDGELQLAWILTGKAEEARVRAALVEAYGKPEFVSKNWEAFDGFRVALRKDKPEVLMVADELVPVYREQMRADGEE
jgi:hypothetical protein